MRRFLCILSVAAFALCASSATAAESEKDIVNRYLKKIERKQTQKLSWLSVNYSLNRINRNNDYNSFANTVSTQLDEGELPWISQASTFGVDFGVSVRSKLMWTVGGEYWMKFGTSEEGPYTYSPALGVSVEVENLQSEIKVYGVSTGVQYYFYNAPSAGQPLNGLSARVNGSVGYYHAAWDLWPEYQNLNLATSTSDGENTTFEGNAPGFNLSLGGDYPLSFFDMNLGVSFGYMYLNFNNIAWYNSQDQEVVVTYDGTSDGRVDLDLSGFRGKIELKRFFSF